MIEKVENLTSIRNSDFRPYMSTSRRNRSKINEKEGFEGGNGGVVGKGLQPEDVDSYERMSKLKTGK